MSDNEHNQAIVEGEALVYAAYDLSELWSDEGCKWHLRFEGILDDTSWVVSLTLDTDRNLPHQATLMRLTWEFYGSTPGQALSEALHWTQQLQPWRCCAECDGDGAWGGHPCESCDGTGLADWSWLPNGG